MRSEQEMLDLILETARNDERIRAVIMNGSRANPNALRDPFQDFDIVYLVTETAPPRNSQAKSPATRDRLGAVAHYESHRETEWRGAAQRQGELPLRRPL